VGADFQFVGMLQLLFQISPHRRKHLEGTMLLLFLYEKCSILQHPGRSRVLAALVTKP